MKKPIQFILSAVPLVLFTLILCGLLLIRITAGIVLPVWGAWGVGLCWAVIIFDYLIRIELFKQIGGFIAMLLAVLILIGALIPQNRVARYPQALSDQMVLQLESGWDAVYRGNIFKNYSLKQQLIDYGTGLGELDPFRCGKMILFGLLGFVLAGVYLFPIEPPGALKRPKGSVKHRRRDSLKPLRTGDVETVEADFNEAESRFDVFNDLNAQASYLTRFGIILLCGALFALQVELLQVLSPSRLVTGRSILDSWLGMLTGLLVFVPLHLLYSFLAERRSKGSVRFNVLGVGVDAVNMSDCLQCFERIIEGTFEVGSSGLRVPDFLSTINPQPSTPNSGCLQSQVSSLKPSPFMTTAMGVAGIVEARRNPELQRILNESVLNTPDGMPLVWLGKLFGCRDIERVYGPDLLRDVCAYSASRGWKHFFYGAAPGIVEKLKAKHPDIRIAGNRVSQRFLLFFAWALEHPEQMREMGGKARQVFEADYSAEANYQRLMEIYQHTF